MRLYRLLAVAAQAEGLHLRRRAAALARSFAWIAAAAVFGIAALITAHVALAAWLTEQYGLGAAAGIVAGGDLAVAGAFVLVARRRDPIAHEARQLRQKMLTAAGNSIGLRDARVRLFRDTNQVWAAVAGVAARAWSQSRRR